MLRVLLFLILLAVVVRAISRLFEGILEGAGYRREIAPGVKLVRDPVCGVYVVPSDALTSGSGQETRYFCSEKCRREWSTAGRGRAATNERHRRTQATEEHRRTQI